MHHTWMDPEHMVLGDTPDTQATRCDPIPVTRPQQAGPHTERGRVGPRAGEGVGVPSPGNRASFWGDGLFWN